MPSNSLQDPTVPLEQGKKKTFDLDPTRLTRNPPGLLQKFEKCRLEMMNSAIVTT